MTTPLIVPSVDETAERIDDCELAYHRYVIARVQLLPSFEAQIRQLTTDIAAIAAARDSWMSHLQQRYGLDDGDQIVADGRIIRVDTTPPPVEG